MNRSTFDVNRKYIQLVQSQGLSVPIKDGEKCRRENHFLSLGGNDGKARLRQYPFKIDLSF
jgi:hypothetical protein